MNRLLTATLLLITAATLPAQQVGYTPAGSPYRDLNQSMELTVMSGRFSALSDPAGVAPQGGGLWGALYGWHAKGPLFLTGSVTRIGSQRRIIDPLATIKDRGTVQWPMVAFDGALSLSLTGDKTYHGFMPLLNAGLGLITDGHTQSDVGDYEFGTRFEFVWGATVRYIVSSRWGLRADYTNRLYSNGYPQSYYVAGRDGHPVLPPDQSKSFWRNNPSFSIGLSYMFSH